MTYATLRAAYDRAASSDPEVGDWTSKYEDAYDALCDYVDANGLTRTDKDVRQSVTYHCAICGEPEGSSYAKTCCTDDQMIEG